MTRSNFVPTLKKGYTFRIEQDGLIEFYYQDMMENVAMLPTESLAQIRPVVETAAYEMGFLAKKKPAVVKTPRVWTKARWVETVALLAHYAFDEYEDADESYAAYGLEAVAFVISCIAAQHVLKKGISVPTSEPLEWLDMEEKMCLSRRKKLTAKWYTALLNTQE